MYFKISLFLLLSSFQLSGQISDSLLVAEYLFSGNADDQTSFSNHGEIFGATPVEDRFGNPESAYEFNGIDNFIRIPHSPELDFDLFDPYSVSVWFNAAEEQTWELDSIYNFVISKYINDNGPTNGVDLISLSYRTSFDDDNEFIIEYLRAENFGLCNKIESSFHATNSEVWHHVVYSSDESGHVSLYFDNQLVSEYDTWLTCQGQNIAPLLIGKRGAILDEGYFSGKVDDLRIYRRAISSEEVDDLFNEDNTTTNIHTLIENNKVMIFPNPVKDNLNVLSERNRNDLSSFEIIDITGRKFLKGIYSDDEEINVESLQSGIYIILSYDNNGKLVYRNRFIKS